MFKSLLRTLPSLTGNVTLACKITDIDIQENNISIGYCREAELKPLQNNLFNRYVSVNLSTGSYEYDISKYYQQYLDVFYKTNFDFTGTDFKIYKEYEENYDRNVNYEFGCKRISYNANKYMFEFFAPLYIDNINDIPDYFEIKLKINDYLEKKLKIQIGTQSNKNFLYKYLEKYISKLDNLVIFYNEQLHSFIYHAIDANNGGFVQIQDSTINYTITDQTTVNLFDKSLNKGFENNKLVMKQIIPISFMFNFSDLLNKTEKKLYKFAKIYNISGSYVKDGKSFQLFDFDMNYNEIFGNIKNLNIYSLPENRFDIYKYENKALPIYNKWRLQLSEDKIYNTNLNVNYFNNYDEQYNSLYMYNQPLTTDNTNGVYIKNNNVNFSEEYLNDYNYSSFEIFPTSILDLPNKFFDISNWSKCINNYAFTNNLLFNLNNIFNQNYQQNIDYFNIFILPQNKENANILDFNIYVKNIFNYSTEQNNQISINDNIVDQNSNLINFNKKAKLNVQIQTNSYFLKSKDFDKNKIQYLQININNKYLKYEDLEKINNLNLSLLKQQNVQIISGYVKINNVNYKSNLYNIYDSIKDQLYFNNMYVNKITNILLYQNDEFFDGVLTDFYILNNFIDYYEFINYLKDIDQYDDVIDVINNLNVYEYDINNSEINKIFKKKEKHHKVIYIDNFNLNNVNTVNKPTIVNLDDDKIINFFEDNITKDKHYITLFAKNVTPNTEIDENLVEPGITQIYSVNHLNYSETNVHQMTYDELLSIYRKTNAYYMYVEDNIYDYNIGTSTYELSSDSVIYEGNIYYVIGELTEDDINSNRPGRTYELRYIKKVNDEYCYNYNEENKYSYIGAEYYAYINMVNEERIVVDGVTYYRKIKPKPSDDYLLYSYTYTVNINDNIEKIRYYAWLKPHNYVGNSTISNVVTSIKTNTNKLNDYLILHKIYNDSNLTDDEIYYQNQLITYGYICFYDVNNDTYIDINDETIKDPNYINYPIVYIDDLSYKHENMIELHATYDKDNIIDININSILIPKIKKEIIDTSIYLDKQIDENEIIQEKYNSNFLKFITMINIISKLDIEFDYHNFITYLSNNKYEINIKELGYWVKTKLIPKLQSLNLFTKELNYKNVLNFLFSDIDQNIHNEILTHKENSEYDISIYLLGLFDTICENILKTKRIDFDIEHISNLLNELYDNREDLFNNILHHYDISLYEYYNSNELINITGNELNNFYKLSDSNNHIYEYYIKNNYIKDNLPIITFNYNGKLYGCILIYQLFTNTNMSYNLDNINIINYINNCKVKDIICEIDTLKLLMPYFKKNILSLLTYQFKENGIEDFCIYPNKYSIILKYGYDIKTSIKDNEYYDSLNYKGLYDNNYDVYKLVDLKNKVRIQLYRYFNYIFPIFHKVNNYINTYKCKYKYEKYVHYGTDNIYNEDININKYNGIKCFNNNLSSKIYLKDYNQEYDFEYKHFNDNLFYNIEPYIEIPVNKKLSYEQLLKYESNEVILKYFTNYIKKYSKYICNDKNLILFLFNKYKVSCHSTSIQLNFLKTYKLYSLKYIFELI